MRKNRGQARHVSLAEFGFSTTPAPPRTRAKKKAAAGFGILTISALLGATLVPVPVVATVTSINATGNWWASIPADVPVDLPLPQHSTMLDADGHPFATFFAENRVPVTGEQISDNAKNAVVSIEDRRFYEHNGVDAQGTLRALVKTVAGSGTQGGSGITQQYVKNLLIANAKTPEEAKAATAQSLARKVSEAKAAINLEEHKTKDEILTGYLNTVFFGDGAYGIGAAAKHYFGASAADLTVPQAALLAGIINAPTQFNPADHPEAALKRRNEVLDRMVVEHHITQDDANKYKTAPLGLQLTQEANGCTTSAYPFYCAWVRRILAENPVFGATEQEREALLYRGGLTIKTALQPKVQQTAQTAAASALDPNGDPATGIAVVVPGTGQVAAIATNRGYGSGPGQTEVIYPIQESFQNGSTFKPLTAAAAIEAGFSPDIRFYAGSSFAPDNRNSPEGGFHNDEFAEGGDYDMAGALRHSVNTWFIKLEDMVGVRKTAETAKKMGITSLPLDGDGAITEKDASLTLGTFSTSPVEVANSYATLAAHGVMCNPTAIVSVTNSLNQNVPVPPSDCHQAIRASTADTVANMLYGNIYDTSDTGRTAQKAMFDRPAAGKTGTADSGSSVWFAGFTPQYATAVWIGDPRGGFAHPLESLDAYGTTFTPVYGGGAPALIWRDVMANIHSGLPVQNFAKPGGETFVGVPMIVPDVRGTTPEEAARILKEAGFTTVKSSKPGPVINGIPAGRVTATDPDQGTVAGPKAGTAIVTVFVSP